MAKIVTFGELMLRLQPYNYERFVQCDHVEFTFGGGEANVAVSLANYGMDAATELKEMIKEKFQSVQIEIHKLRGLCSFYADKGGLLVGFEKA